MATNLSSSDDDRDIPELNRPRAAAKFERSVEQCRRPQDSPQAKAASPMLELSAPPPTATTRARDPRCPLCQGGMHPARAKRDDAAQICGAIFFVGGAILGLLRWDQIRIVPLLVKEDTNAYYEHVFDVYVTFCVTAGIMLFGLLVSVFSRARGVRCVNCLHFVRHG